MHIKVKKILVPITISKAFFAQMLGGGRKLILIPRTAHIILPMAGSPKFFAIDVGRVSAKLIWLPPKLSGYLVTKA